MRNLLTCLTATAFTFVLSFAETATAAPAATGNGKQRRPAPLSIALSGVNQTKRQTTLVFSQSDQKGSVTVPTKTFDSRDHILAGSLDTASQTVSLWTNSTLGPRLFELGLSTKGRVIAISSRPTTEQENASLLAAIERSNKVFQNPGSSGGKGARRGYGCTSSGGCSAAPPRPADPPTSSPAPNCASLNGTTIPGRPGCTYVRCVPKIPASPAGNCDCDADCGPFGQCSRSGDIPCGNNGASTLCCNPPSQSCHPPVSPGQHGSCVTGPSRCDNGGTLCSVGGFRWCCAAGSGCGTLPMQCSSGPTPTPTTAPAQPPTSPEPPLGNPDDFPPLLPPSPPPLDPSTPPGNTTEPPPHQSGPPSDPGTPGTPPDDSGDWEARCNLDGTCEWVNTKTGERRPIKH